MKRSIRIVIALGALGIVIGAYLIVQALANQPADQPDVPVRETIQLLELNPDEITRIELSGYGEDLVLLRGEGGMEPDYPVEVEFRQASVNRIPSAFARLTADRIIEQEPEDRAQYGLDPPQATARYVTESASGTVFVGNPTPDRLGYYVMVEGDPAVYLAPSFSVAAFRLRMDDLRDRGLPLVAFEELTYLRLERTGRRPVEITLRSPLDQRRDPYLSEFSQFLMTEPYIRDRSVATDRLSTFVQGIGPFQIEDFVQDGELTVEDLAEYGLDEPRTELILADNETQVHYQFGSAAGNGTTYARLVDRPGVFTLPGTFAFPETDPFELVDKFAILPNIANVSELRIQAPGETYLATIERTGSEEEPEEAFFIDGSAVDEDPFRDFYQAVIGVLFDAEVTEQVERREEVVIDFLFTDGTSASVVYAPYDENFYAVFQGDIAEFLVSRRQVQRMLQSARDLAAGI